MYKLQYANKTLSYLKDVDLIEVHILIDLLAFATIFKSGNESIHCLFATDGTDRDVFDVSKERFLFSLTAGNIIVSLSF